MGLVYREIWWALAVGDVLLIVAKVEILSLVTTATPAYRHCGARVLRAVQGSLLIATGILALPDLVLPTMGNRSSRTTSRASQPTIENTT